MAEETQVTEATEVAPVEEKKGMGAAGVIGGAAGGVGAYTLADNYFANSGIKKQLFPEAAKEVAKDAAKDASTETTKEAAKETKVAYKEMFDKTLADTTDKTKAAREAVGKARDIKAVDLAKASEVEVAAAKEGIHELTFKLEGDVTKTISVAEKELGKDLTVGKHTIEKAKPALEKMTAKLEKSAIVGVRKANGFFAGFNGGNTKEKALIGLASVAGIVVGAKVMHALFGGSHTKKVEEQAQVEAAPARG